MSETHNFGRRVVITGRRVRKPRTVFWEWLLLSKRSPLRRLLHLDFLPSLTFDRRENIAERAALDPLPEDADPREVARAVGGAIALFTWLGVGDLHWENIIIGASRDGGVIFAPLDVEMILSHLRSPEETRLLPAEDPDYGELYRHAAGVRRALPWLGKPVPEPVLATLARAYTTMLRALDREARAISDVFERAPLAKTPMRVTLRSTAEYARPPRDLWPPFMDEELEQMARGDVPYFFRLYGKPGIRFYASRDLRRVETLPSDGDVPQLEPLLPLPLPKRADLRDPSLVLRSFRSGRVYLPCRCGEVRAVFAPRATRCRHHSTVPTSTAGSVK